MNAPRRMLHDRSADWLLLEWRSCPGCGHQCRIVHRALGTCMTCALPVLREARAA